MLFLRRLYNLRRLVALAALVWLPMSVFAQVCATHMAVSHLGQVPHLAVSGPVQWAGGADLPAQSAKAATYEIATSSADSDCDMKAVCALAAMSVLVHACRPLPFQDDTLVLLPSVFAFATYVPAPDTPPPRSVL